MEMGKKSKSADIVPKPGDDGRKRSRMADIGIGSHSNFCYAIRGKAFRNAVLTGKPFHVWVESGNSERGGEGTEEEVEGADQGNGLAANWMWAMDKYLASQKALEDLADDDEIKQPGGAVEEVVQFDDEVGALQFLTVMTLLARDVHGNVAGDVGTLTAGTNSGVFNFVDTEGVKRLKCKHILDVIFARRTAVDTQGACWARGIYYQPNYWRVAL